MSKEVKRNPPWSQDLSSGDDEYDLGRKERQYGIERFLEALGFLVFLTDTGFNKHDLYHRGGLVHLPQIRGLPRRTFDRRGEVGKEVPADSWTLSVLVVFTSAVFASVMFALTFVLGPCPIPLRLLVRHGVTPPYGNNRNSRQIQSRDSD